MKHTFYLFLLILIGSISPTCASGQIITDLQMHIKSEKDLIHSNYIRPTFIGTFDNGKVKRSDIPTFTALSLRRFKITVEHGQWIPLEKRIAYDLSQVYAHDANIVLTAQVKKDPEQTYHFEIPFPLPEQIVVSYDRDTPPFPGNQIQVHLNVLFNNGMEMSSKAPSGHPQRLNWSLFDLHSNVKLNQNHELLLPTGELRQPDSVWFQAIFKGDSSIRSPRISFPLDYNGPQQLDFSGPSGLSGYSFGRSGGDGEDVNVWVMLTSLEDRPFLKIKAQSATQSFHTLVNPEQGSLLLNCQGGHGGDGADGSDGANGSDATGTCPSTAGSDGEDGQDGGHGGNGGDVFFFTDSATQVYLDLLHVKNSGGFSGNGGVGGTGGLGGGAKPAGSDGSDGSNGYSGSPGGTPEIILIPSSSLRAFWEDTQ